MTIDPKLLYYLDQTRPVEPERWHTADIQPISGGGNNLLYRVQHDGQDLAIKFTIRDKRRRAMREFAGLRAVHAAGLDITPTALLVDEESYQQPVVVQSWLAGETLDGPPRNLDEWRRLVAHYAAVHTIKKSDEHPIDYAVIGFNNGEHGKQAVLDMAEMIPPEDRPLELTELLAWFADWRPPDVRPAQLTLCRVDANYRNFIRREGAWASVDWENSGWGDGAFEIADLMTHPAYEDVDVEFWPTAVSMYAELTDDPECEARIGVYYLQMQMWWVIRWARYLYEIPRGLDQRLVKRNDNWRPRTERKFREAVARTWEMAEAEGYV